jgi:5-methylcytosine-specific restriction endonuclease McrA
MNPYTLTHLSDERLVQDTKRLVARDRATTASLIAHLAEIDRRKLYLPAGFASMFEYCVEELGMSEDQACNRIEVARRAREFPVLLTAIEDGRLSQSAIRELSSHLTSSNAEQLVSEAAGLRIRALRTLLANRFPQAEALRLDAGVIALGPSAGRPATDLSATSRIDPPAQKHAKPLSPNRFALDFTISQQTHDRMRYFQSLIGASNDLADTFDRALEIAIHKVEKRKFGAATRSRNRDNRSQNPRYIPMDVRRAVWMRDEGRCTFVSETERRCTVTGNVEFDHVVPVARGGAATADNLRLLCRAHNQYEAERLLGVGLMERKRRFADVLAAMRSLRAKPAEARAAAEHAVKTAPEAALEEQIRIALRWFRPRGTTTTPAPPRIKELVAG